MILLIAAALLLILVIMDIFKWVRITGPVPMIIWLPFAVNLPLLVWLIIERFGSGSYVLLGVLLVETFYIWLHLNIFPVLDGRKTGTRLKALAGARPLLYCHIYIVTFQVIFLPVSFFPLHEHGTPDVLLTVNIFYSLGCCVILFLNGILRAFICSRRLGILRRILIFLTLWIPVISWVMWILTARIIKQEYLYGYERLQWERTITESDRCQTKYPILMLHGIAFRDMRFYNYWGRIPRYLKRFGADVHYGNQEAFGTIEQNGADIKERIEQILAETGAEKVNIIAHSKGGLDARYAITTLGMADKVASLTTMNSPHHGCRFADSATKVWAPAYRLLTRIFNWTFTRYGDKHADFLTATMQFRTDLSKKFNEDCPDAPGVYYQSYTSVMQKSSSDPLLSIPYHFIRKLGEENDGLVSVSSAQWGVFKGVFRNEKHKRGISHGDIIDLKREDYKGFNVLDAYVGIVSELKAEEF
ncbi:MAG: triacylglycerol lipase [Clostridiales Family XIII bacterium]|jgi:triacylglycerol lipase|nr:triacylglycerol lipase [Clostridiales Family XIII bacterium]